MCGQVAGLSVQCNVLCADEAGEAGLSVLSQLVLQLGLRHCIQLSSGASKTPLASTPPVVQYCGE